MAANNQHGRKRTKAPNAGSAGDASFDPYHKWLGIPPKDQPPNQYRLLALNLFEADAEVIDAAANRQMAYLQQRATGKRAADSQRLLNEITAARLCLLNSEKKAQYDTELRAKLAPERPTDEASARLPKHIGTSKHRFRWMVVGLGVCAALLLALVSIAIQKRDAFKKQSAADAFTDSPRLNPVVSNEPVLSSTKDRGGSDTGTVVEKSSSPPHASSPPKKLFPPKGWPGPTEMAVLRVDQDGNVPDPDRLPRFLRGEANSKQRNWPTFVINSQGESSLEAKVHSAAKAGGVLECWVDGRQVERLVFPASDKASLVNQVYRFSIPSGQHELQLRSTGKGWVQIYWYRFNGCFLEPK